MSDSDKVVLMRSIQFSKYKSNGEVIDMAEEKATRRVWIEPCDCGCGCEEGEEDAYTLTYELPGVNKKDINLKITTKALRLTARRDSTEFVNEFSFVCDADTETVQADYENGMLYVKIPLDCPNPFKEAKAITIN